VPVPPLLYLALRNINPAGTLEALGGLDGPRLAALAAMNLLFLLLAAARWGLVLRGLGVPIALGRLALYRLAGSGVSYLTPGPQVGGEPVLLALARRWSGLGYGPGSASRLIDRSIELASNAAFLGAGAWALLATGALDGVTGARRLAVLLVPAVLMAVPALYLGLSFAGRRPLAGLLAGVSARLPRRPGDRQPLSRLGSSLTAVEDRVAALRGGGGTVLALAAGAFVLIWGTGALEMRLALASFGVQAGWAEVLALMAASRLAFLVPVPGALGVLEATQVSLFALLGFPAGAAHALLLYIRARDLCLAGAGLGVAAFGLSHAPRGASPRRGAGVGASPPAAVASAAAVAPAPEVLEEPR
jgi:uncharacterized protein (TIRG00374 family)